MAQKNPASRLVYSTAHGNTCPKCTKPLKSCVCRRSDAAPAGDGIVRVSRQTKGRKGKGVTLITGVPLGPDELKAYAAQLKKQCATGGAVKQQTIEIQGDHRDRLIEIIKQRGWQVKSSGG
jgi:translation initiation factor 1